MPGMYLTTSAMFLMAWSRTSALFTVVIDCGTSRRSEDVFVAVLEYSAPYLDRFRFASI
jgi:hypothetical protein